MTVIFVFIGILKYKGRLLKQIATLQEAGYQCILIHGQVETQKPIYKEYSFKVVPIRVKRSTNKILNFTRHLNFNIQASTLIRNMRPDFVLCEELYGSLSGAIVKITNPKIVFIFDCNELFMHMGMKQVKLLLWRPIHNLVYSKADVVLHAENQRLQFCKNKYKNSAKHVLLENLPKVNLIPNSYKRTPNKKIRVLYLGAFLPDRCCEEIILAFAGLSTEFASCDFIGFGNPKYQSKLENLIKESDISNVRILPPVSHDSMLKTIESYDIGLAFYRNLNLNQYYCAPNKIYDYLICGLPVISNNYPGLLDVLEQNQIGVCISQITPNHLTDALTKIINNDLQKNITKEIKHKYNWTSQVSTYLDLFVKRS